jgi:hypothetical protein
MLAATPMFGAYPRPLRLPATMHSKSLKVNPKSIILVFSLSLVGQGRQALHTPQRQHQMRLQQAR